MKIIVLPSILLCAAAAGCGPTTALRNDTNKAVYADFIAWDVPRPPSAQKIAPGNLLSAPSQPKTYQKLYVGNEPKKLNNFDVPKLCDTNARNCDIFVSRLGIPTTNVR